MDIKAETTINKEGDNYVIDIKEKQILTEKEFQQDLLTKQQSLQTFQTQLTENKAGLMAVIDVKDKGEEAKIADMMEKAEKIKNKRMYIKNIDALENMIERIEKSLRDLQLKK